MQGFAVFYAAPNKICAWCTSLCCFRISTSYASRRQFRHNIAPRKKFFLLGPHAAIPVFAAAIVKKIRRRSPLTLAEKGPPNGRFRDIRARSL
jgi:hypothetical protein